MKRATSDAKSRRTKEKFAVSNTRFIEFPGAFASKRFMKNFMTSLKLTIKNIRARPVMAPLKRPPRPALGEIPAAALVLIDIETPEQIIGRP